MTRILHREKRGDHVRIDLVRPDDVGFIPAHHGTGYRMSLSNPRAVPMEYDEPDSIVTVHGMEPLIGFLKATRRITDEDEAAIRALENEVSILRRRIDELEAEAWPRGAPLTRADVEAMAKDHC
jgi:hypothetical protein